MSEFCSLPLKSGPDLDDEVLDYKLEPDVIMGILEKGVNIQTYFILPHFALLSFTDVVFLQMEGKILYEQKDYN